MSGFVIDYVAIDTNVFEHLLNRDKNSDGHIGRLLIGLAKCQSQLIVDSKGEIRKEYSKRIRPIMTGESEKHYESRKVLKYWFANRAHYPLRVEVLNDGLMRAIKAIITERGTAVDRIFVYVALKSDRVLVSNDEQHIVVGAATEKVARRQRLLRDTKKHRPNQNAAILTSQEACAALSPPQ